MTEPVYALSEQQRLQAPDRRNTVVMAVPASAGPSQVASALQESVRRHEILRTAFVDVPGWPSGMQRPIPVADAPAIDLVRLDVDNDPAAAAFERAEKLDLDGSAGRVIAAVLATGHGSSALALTGLAKAVDRRSLELVGDELADGDAGSVRYLAYTAWQAQQFGTASAQDWHARLEAANLPERLQAIAPLTGTAGRGAPTPAQVRVPTADAVAESDVDLIASWGTFCASLSGHRVAVVGVLRDGRGTDELRGAVGPFARLMPVPIDLDGDASTAEQVRRWLADADDHVHEHDSSRYRHARFPFAYLGRGRSPERFDLALARDESGALVLRHDAGRISPEYATVIAERFASFLTGASVPPAEPAKPSVSASAAGVPDLSTVLQRWAGGSGRVALVRDGKPLLYSELDITPGGIDTLLGVEDNHRWVASGAFRTARALGLRADDVVLTAWLSGSAGWVRDLTSAWMAGASAVDAAAQREDGAALAHRIVESGASVVDLLPAQWRAVHAAAQEDAELRKQLATGALRLLISSGQLLHARTAEAMLAVGGPATAVLSAYVSPVVHGAVAIRQVSRGDLAQDVIPLGHAVDGVELRIVDEQGRPLPLGVPGRIQVVVGGKGHDTDEVGLLDEDGAVRGQGRDRPVFVHGFRVDVELVEAALDRHPAIAQSLVSQREAGAGLDAFVVVERDQRPTRVDIVSFLRDRVPGYMIPSGFRIVTELPRTPEGGIDYTAAATLADRGWAVS